MRIHNKLALVLLLGVLVIFGVSRWWDYADQRRTMESLAKENLDHLRDREWKNAENVYWSVYEAVGGSLERGEMQKFTHLLQSQTNIQGLLEFSLYDQTGIVTHSSKADLLQTRIPSDLEQRLLNQDQKFTRRTDDAFEIYQPLVAKGECLRCHTTWPEGMVAGVLGFRFSTEGYQRAEQGWTTSLAHTRARALRASIVILCITVAVFGLLSFIVIRTMFAGTMGRALRRATSALTTNADQVATVAQELASSSGTLAEGTSTQAASLQETSASLEELSSMTQHNTSNATQTKELARTALEATEHSAQEIQRMQQAMASIDSAGQQTAKIARTIDEIAFQTNILALNAAVEAARAGEAGAGFAVVADEVRALAQRSAVAAREAAEKVSGVNRETSLGVEITATVAKSLEDILGRVREVDELAAQVATASEEQSRGLGQISGAVGQIDKVTQSNAATAEQSAGAAEELGQRAQDLHRIVQELLAIVGGQKQSAPHPPQFTTAPSSNGKPSARGHAAPSRQPALQNEIARDVLRA